ncbi:MAG TPA: oligosaccharide flippase family protein [Candidatus Polarisedimenticolia bacterium]|nr:oligosaccharide flippase family protein [Candidatus Polarisedimenticolia bacterium]
MRLADQAAVLTAGRLGERLVGILSALALVRIFAPALYGTYLQISMVAGLAASVFTLGLPASLMYYVPLARPGARRALFARITRLTAAGAALAALGLVAGAGWLGWWMHNPAIGHLRLLVAAYTFLLILDRLIEPSLLSLGDALRVGIVDLVSAILMVAATVLPALVRGGVASILVCLVAVHALRLLYLAALLLRLPAPQAGDRETLPTFREIFHFSAPLGLSAIPAQYNRQVDGLLVSFFFTPALYAVYARGAFELPLVELLPFSLAAVILPRLVELWAARDRPAFLRLWNRSLRVSSLVLFPAFAFCLAFAPEIITTLFTERYADAAPVFQIYLLALPLRITSYGTILRAVGDTRGILTSTLYALIATVLISPLLCLKFGPLGAATGYVLSQFVAVAYLLRRISRHSGLRVAQLLPWRSLALCMAVVVPCALAARLATQAVPFGLVRLVVATPLFVLLGFIGLLKTGLLHAEERHFLRRWWSRLVHRGTEAPAPPAAAPSGVSPALDPRDV